MAVEPVPGAPAATADLGGERALVVADYHAGIEQSLRREGVELDGGGDRRRRRLLGLVAETDPDRLVVLGDLVSGIGGPEGSERTELSELVGALSLPVTLVKGNHDGDIESALADLGGEAVTVTESSGVRLGSVGFVHGHTWPGADVLTADVVCLGHEHPLVRLTDEVGGGRLERVWLRGKLDPAPFEQRGIAAGSVDGDIVVFPAFNDRSGGTQVNVADGFLSPFLPAALEDCEAYLLDGTRLGPYERV
jgi:putative SbcD/Mre11-related phosphoesterase